MACVAKANMIEAILISSIGTVGVVLAALIQSGRKENKDDHSLVVQSIYRIETKIDKHIDGHNTGA